MTQQYKSTYAGYPVFAEEMSFEGAFKRYSAMPTPQDVFNYTLMGIPPYFPLSRQPITPAMAEPFLNSAITEIEMELGANISPVVHYHSEDIIDSMFTANYTGIRLQRWPATEIIKMSLKFPHSNTPTPYQTYDIPYNWLYLRRNKLNVVASIGSVTATTDAQAAVTSGGIFTFITGFNRGAYQPGSIEVVYKAGFESDKLPSNVADLIKTWAAHRWLADLIPVMFPQSSVSVGIDSVSQSVTMPIAQLLTQRLELLEKKKKELAAALVKSFGRTVKMSFIGA
jgi:hypothetical protein